MGDQQAALAIGARMGHETLHGVGGSLGGEAVQIEVRPQCVVAPVETQQQVALDKLTYLPAPHLEGPRAERTPCFADENLAMRRNVSPEKLGLLAIQSGETVLFAALADLLGPEALPAVGRRLKRYALPAPLILDELGYLPCDSRSADLLYNIIGHRHERRSASLAVASKSFGSWWR